MEFRKQSNSRTRPATVSSGSKSIDSRPLRLSTPRPAAPSPLPPTAHKRKQRIAIPQLTRKQTVIIASIVLLIAIVLVVVITTASSRSSPVFQTVSPNNTPVEQLGGWKRVSPPDSDPVFSYTDKIDDVTIRVSQQQLPKGFDQDTSSKIAELAKRFNATSKIATASATTYIGTSSKGPQSVILAKRNLLILISSEKAIKNESWATYIDSLE